MLDVLPEPVGTARRLTRDRAAAEDLAAETVSRAWLRLGTLRDRCHFKGWMQRILTNLFLSRCRLEAARPEVELDVDVEFSLFERLHQPFLLWWSNPEQEFLDRVLREDIARAVDALPDHFRTVVVMADIQGYSYGEIAEWLAVPLGTVRSRLARGRALLQRALWEHARDAGLRHGARGATGEAT